MTDDGIEVPEELKKLENIDGLSLSEGMYYCGSSKAYIKFLNTFFHTIDNRGQEIKESLERGDINTYTIKVHSLKSTSRIIGARQLSDFALSLEEAGERGDKEFITENNDKFLQLYISYKDKLAAFFEDSFDNRKEISKNMLSDAYSALREVVPSMDYDAVEMIIGGLREYKLPAADKEKIDKIEGLLEQLKWDEISRIID